MKRSMLSGPRLAHSAETYTLGKAKAFLGRLLEKSEKGTTVYIVRGQKRFLVQLVPEIEPIPMRPPGYFHFDADDVKLDKKLAAANVIPEPNLE